MLLLVRNTCSLLDHWGHLAWIKALLSLHLLLHWLLGLRHWILMLDVALLACFLALYQIAWWCSSGRFHCLLGSSLCCVVVSVCFGGLLWLILMLFVVLRWRRLLWAAGCPWGGRSRLLLFLLLDFGAEDLCYDLVLLSAGVWARATLLSFDSHIVFLGVASNLRAGSCTDMFFDWAPISFE